MVYAYMCMAMNMCVVHMFMHLYMWFVVWLCVKEQYVFVGVHMGCVRTCVCLLVSALVLCVCGVSTMV